MMSGSWLRGYADPIDAISSKTRRGRWSFRQLLIASAALLLVIVAALYGRYWWTTGRFLVSTDDAYVRAHSVLISPKVSGYIAEVPVDDNQSVSAGTVLARIDPRDYQTALDQARANIAAAQASIDTMSRQIDEQQLVVEQARQQIVSDQAALVYSQQNFQRYTALARTGYGTVQMAQQSTSDTRQKAATVQRDSASHAAGEKQMRSLRRNSPRPGRR